MKKCPLCAEEIQDDAVKCRFCGSMLAASSGVEPQAAPVAAVPPERGADQALQFSHSGQRYLLGYGSDFFGIWDRWLPGGDVERFPRTDEGWEAAWRRYASMEPHRIEVSLPVGGAPALGASDAAPPPAPSPATAGTNGFATASLVLGIVGMVVGVVSALALLFGYLARDQIARSGGNQQGAGMAVAGIVLGWIATAVVVILVLLFATGVLGDEV